MIGEEFIIVNIVAAKCQIIAFVLNVKGKGRGIGALTLDQERNIAQHIIVIIAVVVLIVCLRDSLT